jgi:uncharacterized membrane protein
MSNLPEAPQAPGLSVHRLEALTDGIFAVAMTLLVIELKLPEHGAMQAGGGLVAALVHLLPRVMAWVISFLVLALFWLGHYRTFARVRRADGPLATLCLFELGFVSLMPFSSALVGEHGRENLSQIIYSINMLALAVLALMMARHIHSHPDPHFMAMPLAAYRGARVRLIGLMVISALAVGIQMLVPMAGNSAFLLMPLVIALSRRVAQTAEPPLPVIKD